MGLCHRQPAGQGNAQQREKLEKALADARKAAETRLVVQVLAAQDALEQAMRGLEKIWTVTFCVGDEKAEVQVADGEAVARPAAPVQKNLILTARFAKVPDPDPSATPAPSQNPDGGSDGGSAGEGALPATGDTSAAALAVVLLLTAAAAATLLRRRSKR